MVDAFVYLTACSFKNRLRRRLQRLREPRYLVGLVVGLAYMYFMVFRRGGAAVIVSSHLLHLVEEICTRIVIIDHGVKIADGTLNELKARPELAAAGSTLEQIFLTATAGEP